MRQEKSTTVCMQEKCYRNPWSCATVMNWLTVTITKILLSSKQKGCNKKITRQNSCHKAKSITTTNSISSILKDKLQFRPKKRKSWKTINYKWRDLSILKGGERNIWSNTIRKRFRSGTENVDLVWVNRTRYKTTLCFMVQENWMNAHQRWKTKFSKDNMLKSSNTFSSFIISWRIINIGLEMTLKIKNSMKEESFKKGYVFS